MLSQFNSANDDESMTENQLPEPIPDLLFTETEAKNLRFRLHLMLQLLDYIQHKQWTAHQAAKKLKVNLTTINHLAQRKIWALTTDQLLNMMEYSGFNVYQQLDVLIGHG